ncbi:galactokinase [Silvibacterium dinghuense]|uniref:Galactokinase n=1 Tax=Silvibacterium dinghuense TaxID=1560006 RepID=A0A4Q1SIT0_9BACT|nr:galactokinase [Silvibacterium dinghuense]RXS97524.1 galactokinase [Silvibacterium dinghuense]GGG99714.1 galactokinase [Silvibacterium dinghuense]
MLDVNGTRDAHFHAFQQTPALFLAPGRVNLIGEHTDYAEGFVMPAAIDFATIAAISPRTDGQVVIASQNFQETVAHPLNQLPARAQHHWSDYPLGVLAILRGQGIEVPAFSLTLNGDVPVGAGLSSSASVEVATISALLHMAGKEIPLPQMARLCQRAENEFVGASTGIMDQFIACCGAENHALLLDCRSLAYKLAPIPADVAIVISNTMVKHSHAGGEYNTRRAEVEEATRVIASHRPEVRFLRDATVEDLQKWGSEMSPDALKRARHIITENTRTEAAAAALEAGDLKTLGRLMYEAHASYRDDFEASCPEADILVDLASQEAGCIGARLTGGGFGGCTVNLVEQAHADTFIEHLREGYHRATGIAADIYRCHASAGVHRIEG